MKKSAVLFLLLLAIAGNKVQSQSCTALPVKEGSEWELQTFNDKDKLTGTLHYKVLSIANEGGFTIGTIQSDIYDEKGKLLNSGTMKFRCNGDQFYVDMSNLVSDEQMKAFEGMEVTGDVSYLEFPSSMSAGESLPDGSFHLDIINNGSLFGTIDAAITERKVAAIENVTVPAGTFNCYKIHSKSNVKISMLGIGIPVEANSIDWYSKGMYFVRSESYNKNMKLIGYTVLASFKF